MPREKLNLDVDPAGTVDTDDDLPPALDENAEGMSDDDFGNIELDNDEAERTSMEINPPSATWEKASRFEYTRSTNMEDHQPGDIITDGRTYFRFEGVVEPKTIEGQTYTPKLTISISPDKRADRRDPSKHDGFYLLYVKAWEIYIADTGTKPKNFNQLTTHLRDAGYFIRTYRGNNGPFINELISKADMKKRSR